MALLHENRPVPTAENVQRSLPPALAFLAVFAAYILCMMLAATMNYGMYLAAFGPENFGLPRALALMLVASCEALAAPVSAGVVWISARDKP